ncbi:MAG: hypothetical protein M1490_04455 [Candidatus Bathyarchaeota archaeon]|nr:hypothetical protein [Candidatus Bathyarchaeota archaeon]
MRKHHIFVIIIFYFFAQIALVSAQTTLPTPTPESQNLIGTTVAAAILIVLFAFIAYAGFRVVKKWSRTEAD